MGLTTDTEGMAICAVTVRKLLSAFTRERIPKISTAATMSAMTSAVNQRLEDGLLAFPWLNGTVSGWPIVSLISMSFIILTFAPKRLPSCSSRGFVSTHAIR